MSSWDTILSGLTWLGDYFGLASQTRRTARGAVLGELTRYHGLVNQLCGGFALTAETRAAFYSEFDSAYQAAAIKLNEMSQSVGRAWLNDTDRLMALGRRAVWRVEFASSNRGPIAAKASEEAHQDHLEFARLFKKLRG